MGAYSFSISSELLHAAKEILDCQLFIETGTFHGKSSLAARRVFPRVLTCEYSEAIRAIATANFNNAPEIESFHGHSPEFLRDIRHRYENVATCFWLDAHWCASGIDTQSPGQTCIIEELASINTLNKRSAVFIDDARYYLAPPKPPNRWQEWPDLTEVMAALQATSSSHKTFIYNDVICFVPAETKAGFVARLGPTLIDPAESLRTIVALSKKVLKQRLMVR
jgi:hypothetical protein